MDSIKRLPLAPTGLAGVLLAFIGLGLAFYGFTPFAQTLKYPQPTQPDESKMPLYALTMFAPMLLGFTAFCLGLLTPRIVERSGGKKAGEGPAMFSLLIGMLAFVLGGVGAFVVFVYPKL
jgi:hypothetical protein